MERWNPKDSKSNQLLQILVKSLQTARNYLFTLPFKASVRKNSVFKFFIIKSTYVRNKKRQNQQVKVLPEFVGLKVQEI